MKKGVLALVLSAGLIIGAVPEQIAAAGYDSKTTASMAYVTTDDGVLEICDDFAIAVGKSAKIALSKEYFYYDIEDLKVTWSCNDAAVATVSSDGDVKGITEGVAILTAEYEYSYYPEYEPEDNYEYETEETSNQDNEYDFLWMEGITDITEQPSTERTLSVATGSVDFALYVTDPSLVSKKLDLNIYGLNKTDGVYYTDSCLEINGTSSASRVSVDDSAGLVVRQYGDEVYIYPKKKGEYTVKLDVDGKKLSCRITVASVYFKWNKKSSISIYNKKWREGVTMLAMKKGETTNLYAKGFPGKSKIKWSSSNKKVVAVNSKGVVRAKGIGEAVITAKSGTYSITYRVGVSYDRAVKALRYAFKHYNSTYSQPLRMKKGYYDCSSYVWRSYMDAGFNIGNAKNWAPTAAALAAWCSNNKYMLYEGSVKTSKLLPGDLIFWTGADNGRYKGIYHVDLYEGNNMSITVGTQKFYSEYLPENTMVARPAHRK